MALALALAVCKAQALDRALAEHSEQGNTPKRLDDGASVLASDRPKAPERNSPVSTVPTRSSHESAPLFAERDVPANEQQTSTTTAVTTALRQRASAVCVLTPEDGVSAVAVVPATKVKAVKLSEIQHVRLRGETMKHHHQSTRSTSKSMHAAACISDLRVRRASEAHHRRAFPWPHGNL